jgi:hypothetical protein
MKPSLWPLVLASLISIVPWECFALVTLIGVHVKSAHALVGTAAIFAFGVTPAAVLIMTLFAWIRFRRSNSGTTYRGAEPSTGKSLVTTRPRHQRDLAPRKVFGRR